MKRYRTLLWAALLCILLTFPGCGGEALLTLHNHTEQPLPGVALIPVGGTGEASAFPAAIGESVILRTAASADGLYRIRIFDAAGGTAVETESFAMPAGGEIWLTVTGDAFTVFEHLRYSVVADYGRFVGQWYPNGDTAAEQRLEFHENGSWCLAEKAGDAWQESIGGQRLAGTETAGHFAAQAADGTEHRVILWTDDVLSWGADATLYMRIRPAE